ncbi:MAG: NUDIX domain-containing protein [Chlamydiota bacterium]
MEKQFTATAYILHEDKVLLLHHPKHGKWLPPGGHLEENETPPQAALREVKEETGLDVAIVKDEHLWVKRWNASSFERPFLCLLENIPPHGTQPAHQHVDFIYVCRLLGGQTDEVHQKMQAIRWFTLDEVRALKADVEIFCETQETLEVIFQKQVLMTPDL